MATRAPTLTTPALVVPHQEWLAARAAFLVREKEFTHARDELSRARRALPWERVEPAYRFDSPTGEVSFADLFGSRSQLVVYHFMFAPGAQAGCPACSFWADNFNGVVVHLAQRDVSFVAISRAPVEQLERFRQRMGWSFRWVSSGRNSFNYDLGVSFTPEQFERGEAIYNYRPLDTPMADREGISVFCRGDDGTIYHTYSTYARGLDLLNTAYNYLDLVPRGRDEDGPDSATEWVRHHDRYDDPAT